eukprot:gene10683-9375_t
MFESDTRHGKGVFQSATGEVTVYEGSLEGSLAAHTACCVPCLHYAVCTGLRAVCTGLHALGCMCKHVAPCRVRAPLQVYDGLWQRDMQHGKGELYTRAGD